MIMIKHSHAESREEFGVNRVETILVEKAFSDNWFNETYDLNLTKDQLRELLQLATTNQLFERFTSR